MIDVLIVYYSSQYRRFKFKKYSKLVRPHHGGGFLRHYIDRTDKKKKKVKPPDFELLGVGTSVIRCVMTIQRLQINYSRSSLSKLNCSIFSTSLKV